MRVRLVPGEEDGETARVEEDAVPAMTVTFTLDIDGLPETALDMIDWREVVIEDGTITDSFEPFAVRAYRIVPD